MWNRVGTKIVSEYESLTVAEFRARFKDDSTLLNELISAINEEYKYIDSLPKKVRRIAYSLARKE